MNRKFKKAMTTSIILASSIIMATSSFAADLIPMEKNDKYGFKNEASKIIVDAKYDGYGHETGGVRPVLKNGKWGYIDSNGKEVGRPIYDGLTNFRNGFAPALKNGKWGVLNTSGNEVVQFKYDELYYYDNQGNANAKLNGKWGKINKNGEKVVPFMYEKADVETKATPTISELTVNGEAEDLSVYTIDGNNYIKLRDMAQMLDGTDKQFEIAWNKEKHTIDLLSEESYSSVGGELENNTNSKPKLRFNESQVSKDGNNVDFQAYNIDDNNYFKLRDISESFNIGVDWNQETKGIEIDTSKGYTAEGEEPEEVEPEEIESEEPEEVEPQLEATSVVSEFIVDGKKIDPSVYTIDENNYTKLRDVAQMLKDTGKGFEVTWNEGKGTMDLLSGTPYTSVGGELEKDDSNDLRLRKNGLKVFKDGNKVDFEAYNINNNNYFKLRDIAESFNIGVTWNPETQGVEIDTTTNYTPE